MVTKQYHQGKEYCQRCGRELVETKKKVGSKVWDRTSGEECREFYGHIIPVSEILLMGRLQCPSFHCRRVWISYTEERIYFKDGRRLYYRPTWIDNTSREIHNPRTY